MFRCHAQLVRSVSLWVRYQSGICSKRKNFLLRHHLFQNVYIVCYCSHEQRAVDTDLAGHRNMMMSRNKQTGGERACEEGQEELEEKLARPKASLNSAGSFSLPAQRLGYRTFARRSLRRRPCSGRGAGDRAKSTDCRCDHRHYRGEDDRDYCRGTHTCPVVLLHKIQSTCTPSGEPELVVLTGD